MFRISALVLLSCVAASWGQPSARLLQKEAQVLEGTGQTGLNNAGSAIAQEANIIQNAETAEIQSVENALVKEAGKAEQNLLAGEKPLNEAEASQEAAMIKDSAKEEMQALEAEAPMNEAKYSIDHAIRNGQIKNFVTTLAKPYQEVFVAVVNLIKAEQALLGNDEATSEANEMKLIQDMAVVFEAVLHYLYTGKQNFGPAEVALKDIRAFGERVLKLIIDSPKELQVPVINVMRAVANAVLYAPLRNLNGRMNAAGKSARHFGLNAASTWSQQLMALAPKLWTEVYNPKELVGWASRFIKALEGSETDAVKQLSQ